MIETKSSLGVVLLTSFLLVACGSSDSGTAVVKTARCRAADAIYNRAVREARSALTKHGFYSGKDAEYCVLVEKKCEDCKLKSDALIVFKPKAGGNWSGAIVSLDHRHEPQVKIEE